MEIEGIQHSSETQEFRGEEVGYGVYETGETGVLNDELGVGDVPNLKNITGLGTECDRIAGAMLEEASRNGDFVAMEPERFVGCVEEELDPFEQVEGGGDIEEMTFINKRIEWVRQLIFSVAGAAKKVSLNDVLEGITPFEGASCHVKQGIVKNNLMPKIGRLLDSMEENGVITRRQIKLKGRTVNVVLLSKDFINGLLKHREKV